MLHCKLFRDILIQYFRPSAKNPDMGLVCDATETV